ncbi:MAG TPA: AMP-binding protein, partial [Candidatus Dormibacteraeota bacterium]|nr:AMP-binding protein [Candidatus Dormibacteraeota bacterium]
MSFNTPAATVAPPTAPDVIDIEVSNRSVPELFQEQVAKRRAMPAMYFKSAGKWHDISWEQYGAAVKRIAGFLLAERVQPAERVAILSYNRPEWHIADLAIEHVGGVVVGIYMTSSPSQCQYIIGHAEAPVIFVEDRDQLAKVMEVRDQLPMLRRVVLINGDVQAGDGELVVGWDDALQAGAAHNAEE